MPSLNNYISYFSKPRIDKSALVVEVLSQFEYKDLIRFKKMTPRMFQTFLKLPYLRRKSFGDLIKRGKAIAPIVKDVYGALTFIIQQNADILNRYVELKEKLDIATAMMRYDEAYEILDQIEKEVSVSMTTTYYRLKLTRLDKGINASSQLYNTICEDNKLLTFITHFALKSASADIPFEAEIERAYNTLNCPEDLKGLLVAFAFPYMDIVGDKWMRLLSLTSIIDLYEGFILQLNKLEPEQLKEEHLKEQIEVLASEIHDSELERLFSLLIRSANDSARKKYIDEREIIELYYIGDYDMVIEKSGKYLAANPLCSTIIDLYNRSCVKKDTIKEDSFPEESIVKKLYFLSYMASVNGEYSELCRTNLRSLCMAWYSIPCMRHLYSLYKDIETTRHGSVYHRFWAYSPVPEVRDACFYETEEEAIDYLRSVGYHNENSVQIGLIAKKNEDRYNQTFRLLKGIDVADIDPLRKAIDLGEIAPVLADYVVSQLFDILIAEFRFEDAVSMYVDYKLRFPFSKIYLDRVRLSKELTDEIDRKFTNQLKLASFYTMIGGDTYKRYLAYKRYLKQQGVRKASEVEGVGGNLYLYFIGKVADMSVLTLHVRAFDTDDDVNIERIELCKKAFALSNDKVYADEITSLIKEQEIKTLAQQVNDSKIHVDVQSLISSELDAEKAIFDIYKELDSNIEICEQKDIEWMNNYIQERFKDKIPPPQYEQLTVKYKIVLFRQLVLSIRDKFLFDPRYGLDKYLSARIRHGTLITQLRNHFLTHSLVTNKKEGGEYVRESAWTHMDVSLPINVKEQVNNRLLQFTEWLDEQLRVIKEDIIQIWTEHNDDKKGGLFNYSVELIVDSLDDLCKNDFETFDALVHATIRLLWEWTNDNLREVRKFFAEYEEKVLTEMDRLQSDIITLISQSSRLSNDFKDAITACKTEFQTDIKVVSNWFKPERSKVRFFTVRQAVETSLSVINKINQNVLKFENITIEDNSNYKGDYFNAVYDIFHDLMSNILGYEAKRPHMKGNGKIRIAGEEDLLIIEVSNPVDQEDIKEIETILIEQQNFPMLIEGGKTRRDKNSGCVKIYSTVMYTLGGKSRYENRLENNYFIARIQIDANLLKYNEDSLG